MKTGYKTLVITTSGEWLELGDNTLILVNSKGTSVLESGDWCNLITQRKMRIPFDGELLWRGSVEHLQGYNHILIAESESEDFLVYKLGKKLPPVSTYHFKVTPPPEAIIYRSMPWIKPYKSTAPLPRSSSPLILR
jgi:hypothetical protein